MTQEEEHIKQKIENVSDLDMYFDDSDLWNRLEERLDEKTPKKRKFLWIWSAAACVLMGVFFFVEFKKKEILQAMILPKSPSQPSVTAAAPIGRAKSPFISKTIENKIIVGQVIDSQSIREEIVKQKQLNIELNKLTFKDNFDTLSFNKKTITYQPKFKIEDVTIVDFPIIPDALMKREVFAKRLYFLLIPKSQPNLAQLQ